MKKNDMDLKNYVKERGGIRAICQLDSPDEYLASKGLYRNGILNLSQYILRTHTKF